jgi:hypothetical protein
MKGGSRGWGLLVFVVIVFDAWAIARQKETMSEAFARGIKSPAGVLVLGGIWTYVTAHLFRVLPEWLDVRKWVPEPTERLSLKERIK